MKILVVSHYCDPEPNMTRGLVFARRLVELGHEVQILTGFPNYPNGTIYPGYRIRPIHREMVDGVSILRVAMYPSHDESALHRVANYVSFGLSAAVLGSLFARRPDVIYAWHPPLTTGLAATALSITKRVPFVYDVQDLWPDTLEATGMIANQRLLAIVDKVAGFVYQRAARIAAQSPGFRAALIDRGVPDTKIDVIYNWAHEGELKVEHDPEIAGQMNAGEKFNVVFAGTMGRAQGLETVLDAAQILASSHPNIQFVLAGGGVEVRRLKGDATQRRLTNVLFLPRMPVDRIGGVLHAADVLLIHLKDERLFEITIPNKAQDYLLAGRPILLAGQGDVAHLISASAAGLVCPPSNPSAMAAAIVDLATMEPSRRERLGKNGADFYMSELSLARGADRFMRTFVQVGRSGAV